jgi:hypothetical protein
LETESDNLVELKVHFVFPIHNFQIKPTRFGFKFQLHFKMILLLSVQFFICVSVFIFQRSNSEVFTEFDGKESNLDDAVSTSVHSNPMTPMRSLSLTFEKETSAQGNESKEADTIAQVFHR